MRIDQLRFFLEVAGSASINKASEKLYISQQSLNISLTKLEQELGVTLFQRSSQGVTLTNEGNVVLNYAIDILKRTEALQSELEINRSEMIDVFKGSLELSICPPVSHWVIPIFLKNLHMEYPELELSIIECENMEMIYSLLNNSQRLCIMNIYERFNREIELLNLDHLFFRELCDARTSIIVSEKHPLADQKTISASVLKQYPLAIFQASEKTTNSVEEYLKSTGTKPNVIFKSNNLGLYQDYLEVGDTIGFMGKCFNKKFIKFREGLRIIPIKDFPKTKIVCLSTLEFYNRKNALIELFLERMCRYLN